MNERYICYGLRAGQIRVLHKDTAMRALLRGHTQQIGDMRFNPSPKDDVVASFGTDGNLFVKKIVSSSDAIDEKPLLQITVSPAPEGDALTPRVRWLSRTKLVATIGDGIFIADVNLKVSEPTVATLDLTPGADAPDGVVVVAPVAGKPAVADVDVAPADPAGKTTALLATAHIDGSVRVWSETSDADGGFTRDSAFTPFEEHPDAPLGSVAFAGPRTVVVGGERNARLALWSLGDVDDDMMGAEHVQTLTFAPDADVFNYAACAHPEARLILLANLRAQTVYAVHLAEKGAGFDYVSEYSVTMPVLSFTAVRETDPEAPADPSRAGTLQLYCMQTQAIQQYALAVDRCRPEGSVGDESCAWYTNAEEEESESEDEDAEDEDATVAIRPAAVAAAVSVAPGTPAATTPTATRQDSATKLLTPMELMSMASGAKGVEPTAEKPAEEPAPAKAKAKVKARPAPKQAPPPPQGPPPQGPPPPRGPPPHGHGPPPPPPGHLEASLAGLREQIYNDIAGFVAAQQAEIREERAAREAAERERQKQLLTAVSAAITRDLPVQIEKLLKRELKILAPVVAAEIAKANKSSGADDKAMAKALPGALATAMSSTVVPKFEAATSEMFDQVRGVFERGMDDLAQELYTQKENAVAAEVGPLVTSLRAAAGEVRVAAEILAAGDVAAGAGAGAGAGGAGAGAPSSLAELESQMDPTVELGAMVDAGDLEGAFTKALGMSSVETVAWVCGRAEPRREEIFGASPAGLSQGVLLSLAQQLSCDLDEEPTLKLGWIRDACLAVDPSDPQLSAHMRPILESVFNGLHESATAPETPAPVKSDLRLCIHVVNSLLTACK